MRFQEKRLSELFENFKKVRIAVIGDLMLDRYLWGTVARISPEAPVPVVEVQSESTRLGGAANVANNIKSLGGTPVLIGVCGDDNSGKQLRNIVAENGFPADGILIDQNRPTTVKTRIIAHAQHVVRIDRETKINISASIQKKLLDFLQSAISTLDAIIIEDYNKGVIVKELISPMIGIANAAKKIVTIDPKFNNFFEYRHTTVFKPNRKEVEDALGMKLNDDSNVEEAGKILFQKLNPEYVLLTRGEKGMSLFQKNGSVVHLPTKAREVADVSGAGDTVISTLTMVLTAGGTIQEAADLANYAGGVVCGEVGIVPIAPDALAEAALNDHDATQ